MSIVSLRLFAEEYGITRIELSDTRLIAERAGKKIMTGGKFPRIEARKKTMIDEIKKTLQKLPA